MNINCTEREYEVQVWFCCDGPVGNGNTANVTCFVRDCDIFNGQDQIGTQPWNGIATLTYNVPEVRLKEFFLGQCTIIWSTISLMPLAGTTAKYEVQTGIDFCAPGSPAYINCGFDPGEHVLVIEADFGFNLPPCDVSDDPPPALA